MAFGHGKVGVFSIQDSGGTLRNISAGVTDVSWEQDGDVVDVSTFGNNAKAYIAGLTDSQCSVQGLFDPTALVGTHTVLSGLVGFATPRTYEFGPQGSGSGAPRITGTVICTKYNPAADIGGAVGVQADFQGTGTVTYNTYP